MASRLRKIMLYGCVARHHLVARCPYCETGVFLATCPDDFRGLIEPPCSDCGQAVPLYVLMSDRKAWMLAEPVEVVKPRPVKIGTEHEAVS